MVGRIRGSYQLMIEPGSAGNMTTSLEVLAEPYVLHQVWYWCIASFLIFISTCILPICIISKEIRECRKQSKLQNDPSQNSFETSKDISARSEDEEDSINEREENIAVQ